MKASLAWVALRVTTEPLFISEPVAGRVSTVPKGSACSITLPPLVAISQGSPSKRAAAATNLVPSMTEPPPTASRKSSFSRRTWATASISVS